MIALVVDWSHMFELACFWLPLLVCVVVAFIYADRLDAR